jgi:hypothetical protein
VNLLGKMRSVGTECRNFKAIPLNPTESAVGR